MVELKILEETEAVAERLQGREMIQENVVEFPPKEAVKLIERRAARTASWTDFEEERLSPAGFRGGSRGRVP